MSEEYLQHALERKTKAMQSKTTPNALYPAPAYHIWVMEAMIGPYANK